MLFRMAQRRRLWILVGFILVLGVARLAAAAPVDRISEYEPTATEAWGEHGFRVQLRFGMESVDELERSLVPQRRFSFATEPGIRLGRWFSISGTLRYTTLETGLRFSNSADLTFHPFHGLHMSAGVGYGGVWLTSCSGGNAIFLTRVGWLLPLGQVFATGPVFQWDWQQEIRCDRRRVIPAFPSSSFSWSFAWR